MTQPNTAVARAAAAKAAIVNAPNNSEDKLVLLRTAAVKARDLELEIEDLLAQAKEKQSQLNALQFGLLPDLFTELKIDNLGVPAEGNKPGKDYKLQSYYSAAIAAKWSNEKKEEAFALLKRLKAESLIKTQVTAALPKGQLKVAKQLVAAAKKLKVTASLNQSVHKGTLTAWLKSIYDNGQSLSQTDLEKIGGSVGRIVRSVERDQ